MNSKQPTTDELMWSTHGVVRVAAQYWATQISAMTDEGHFDAVTGGASETYSKVLNEHLVQGQIGLMLAHVQDPVILSMQIAHIYRMASMWSLMWATFCGSGREVVRVEPSKLNQLWVSPAESMPAPTGSYATFFEFGIQERISAEYEKGTNEHADGALVISANHNNERRLFIGLSMALLNGKGMTRPGPAILLLGNETTEPLRAGVMLATERLRKEADKSNAIPLPPIRGTGSLNLRDALLAEIDESEALLLAGLPMLERLIREPVSQTWLFDADCPLPLKKKYLAATSQGRRNDVQEKLMAVGHPAFHGLATTTTTEATT
jgi:hypothetical protein